jgi:hypothetical protein
MSGYSFGRRGRAVAPTDDFHNLGAIDENQAMSATRSTLANRAMSATEKKNREYFGNLRKFVSNALSFKKKQSQYIQQSQISPRVSAPGTSRQPPYYTSASDNTYFKYVHRREPVMSRGRSAAEAEKNRSRQTIRGLPEDIIRKLFKYTVAHKEIVLDIKLLNKYFKEHKNGVVLSGVDNDEYESFLKDIITVHLEDVKITDAILEILKKTIIIEPSKISTIILRNITFSNDEICKNFLEYLSENTELKILILDNVGIERDNFNKFLSILENFKDLELLEFSNFNITRLFKVINNVQFHYFFMKVIINLHALNYLIFNNNIITQKDYTYLFNLLNGVNNYYVIDLGRDGIYLKYNDNKDNKDIVKSGEQFMHIIEIDTAGRKTLGKCVDRYSIEFHTYGNKDELTILNDFRHKKIKQYAQIKFEKYNVPLNLLSTF